MVCQTEAHIGSKYMFDHALANPDHQPIPSQVVFQGRRWCGEPPGEGGDQQPNLFSCANPGTLSQDAFTLSYIAGRSTGIAAVQMAWSLGDWCPCASIAQASGLYVCHIGPLVCLSFFTAL